MKRSAYGRWLLALRVLVVGAGLLPWLLLLLPGASAWVSPSFALLCHQKAERTLTIGGEAMIVCSRCAGLYGAAALGAALQMPRRWLARGPILVGIAVALAVLDVALQDLGVHPPWHPTRLATGALIGWTASGLMFAWLAKERDDREATSPSPWPLPPGSAG